MEKIDLKDRKILYELDKDSRQSFRRIGRKVGLSKDVVKYRINRLIEKKVILNFYTVIDSFKLGYNSVRFYIVFQNTYPEIRKEIIDYFVNNKFTWWVGTFEGDYDLAVILWIKELTDFHTFWEKTLQKYHKYFQKQIFADYIELTLYRHSFLLDVNDKSDREHFGIIGGKKEAHVDNIDLQILKFLAENSRISSSVIAKNLDLTFDTIKNRIKNMIKRKIIHGFRVGIDYSKLGYQFFKVNINLNDYEKRTWIINFVINNPHLIMIDKSIGYYDLELEFFLNDLNQFHKIMDDLVIKFPGVIKNYNYVHNVQSHKMLFLPTI
jgi:Lrp/AsnC family leucine-responsive transcriptional regulator